MMVLQIKLADGLTLAQTKLWLYRYKRGQNTKAMSEIPLNIRAGNGHGLHSGDAINQ